MERQKVTRTEINESIDQWNDQKRKLGQQLFELRQKHRYSLDYLSHRLNIPLLLLEHLEGGIGAINMGHLLHLCRFYRHHLIVEVGEPYPPLEQQN